MKQKRLLTALVAACLLMTMLSMAVGAYDPMAPLGSGVCGENLTWRLTAQGLYIEGTGDMYDYDIPNGVKPPWSEYNQTELDVHLANGVTSIGNYAFSGYKKVIIYETPTIRRIGAYAFSNAGIYSTSYKSAVESIEEGAYSNNSTLEYCYIESTTRTVGSLAYADCPKLKQIQIKEGPEVFGDRVFRGCESLVEITFPASTKKLGSELFLDGDVKLRQIVFLGNLPQLASDTFAGVTARVYYPANNPTWTEEARGNYGGNLIWFPFTGDSLTTAGTCGDDIAWEYDAETKTIRLSGTGTTDSYGLMRDPKFPTTYIEVRSPWDKLELDIRHVVIEEGITALGEECFRGANAETVSLPSTLVSVGKKAFSGTKLQSLTLPEGLQTIGESAFTGTALTEITFPYSLTTLGSGAFNGSKLQTITFQGPIPGGNNGLSGLTAVIRYPACFTDYPNRNWQFGGTFTYEAFDQEPRVLLTGKCGDDLTWDFYDSGRLHIYGTGDMYDYTWENPAPWDDLPAKVTELDLDEGITSLGNCALYQSFFYGSGESYTLTVPSTVTRVGAYALDRLSGIQTVEFLGDMPQFDPISFKDMNLFIVYPYGNETWTADRMLPYGGTTYYASYAKDGSRLRGECTDTTYWTLDTATGTLSFHGTGALPDLVYYGIGPWNHWQVMNEFEITAIVFEEGITHIGANLCRSMTTVQSIHFPSTLTSIGDSAFNGCSAVTDIVIPDSVIDLSGGVFGGCRSLRSAYIGSGVTKLGGDLFYGCSSLERILIPGSVTEIGLNAFNGTGKLSTVAFLGTAEQWRAITRSSGNEPLSSAGIYCLGASGGKLTLGSTCVAAAVGGQSITCEVPLRTGIAVFPGTGSITLTVTGSTAEFRLVNPDGTTLPMEGAVEDENGIRITVTQNCAVIASPTHSFQDVDETAYYYPAVLWAVENNITKGKSEFFFDPTGPCTRKQVVTFLWRAAGCPDPESMENPFTDVTRGDQFEKAILWAYYEGITKGTTATEFSPENVCTRKQIVTFLWRYNDCPAPASWEHPFLDVKQDQFAAAILWAYHAGITTGKSAFTFQPEAVCTRAQIVTFLYRSKQLPQ